MMITLDDGFYEMYMKKRPQKFIHLPQELLESDEEIKLATPSLKNHPKMRNLVKKSNSMCKLIEHQESIFQLPKEIVDFSENEMKSVPMIPQRRQLLTKVSRLSRSDYRRIDRNKK